MRIALQLLVVVAPLCLTAACSSHDDAANVGGLSPDEASQLNNAAEMLDASADDMALPPNNNTADPDNAN